MVEMGFFFEGGAYGCVVVMLCVFIFSGDFL